jgi:hypothetical protein
VHFAVWAFVESGINTIGWQTSEACNFNIGCRKADRASALIAFHHSTHRFKMMTQHLNYKVL